MACIFVVEHNVSLSKDYTSRLFTSMFPDSKIVCEKIAVVQTALIFLLVLLQNMLPWIRKLSQLNHFDMAWPLLKALMEVLGNRWKWWFLSNFNQTYCLYLWSWLLDMPYDNSFSTAEPISKVWNSIIKNFFGLEKISNLFTRQRLDEDLENTSQSPQRDKESQSSAERHWCVLSLTCSTQMFRERNKRAAVSKYWALCNWYVLSFWETNEWNKCQTENIIERIYGF